MPPNHAVNIKQEKDVITFEILIQEPYISLLLYFSHHHFPPSHNLLPLTHYHFPVLNSTPLTIHPT